jgi:hypothetical protein
MDDERIKQAVLSAIERSDLPRLLTTAMGELVGSTGGAATPAAPAASGGSPGTQTLLTRIVLGDILDDSILEARPQDRTFPLRLLFSELGTLLAHDDANAELAFTLASGLNFFFRAAMDAEAKVRVGLEVSRQLYTLAHDATMGAELVAKAAPLLAAIMSSELERVRFESVDHTKIFDSQVHERTAASDPTASRIVRPASFLCRVQANNAVKAKAQVVT